MQIHSNRHTQSKWNFGLACYSLWPETRPFPTQAQSATKRIQIQFDYFGAPGRQLETFSHSLGKLRTFSVFGGNVGFRGVVSTDIEFATLKVRLYEALSVKAVLIQLS